MASLMYRYDQKRRSSLLYVLLRFGSTSIEEPHQIKKPSTASLKRGTGGRCSFNGIVATIFGATGLVGNILCNQLGKHGTQLIIPYRGDFYDVRGLKVVGDLGQVLFQPFHLNDEDSIRKCMRYSNVVVNLIGRDWETKNFKFEDVHVSGAKRIAKLAKEMKVEKLIHLSALNAAEDPPPFMISGGSKFYASKWEGEQEVLKEFPDAVIFRPSDIYGSNNDRFVRYFCSSLRHHFSYVPLYKKGEETEKQPVYVGDVARGIEKAITDPKIKGEIIQAVGPNRYLLSELVDWFHEIIRRTEENCGYRRIDLRYSILFRLYISLLPKFSLAGPYGNIHWEKIEREIISDEIDNNLKTLKDLGVNLTYMEDQVPFEIKLYRHCAYYRILHKWEDPDPEPPETISTS